MKNLQEQDIKNYTLQHGTVVFVKKTAIVNNILNIQNIASKSELSLVLKNNAYGFGVKNIFNIVKDYCNHYFVANLLEGIELRKLSKKINIYVLNGIMETTEQQFIKYKLIPVLNTIKQIEIWGSFAVKINKKLPVILQLETGINRFGLTNADIEECAKNTYIHNNFNILYIMAHLACGEYENHFSIQLQYNNFIDLIKKLPKTKYSLAASSGTLIGNYLQQDMIRIGLAIYGGNALPYLPNKMENVLYMYSQIVQIKHIKAGEGVGYGYTFIANKPTVLAIIPVGYADGFIKAAANKAFVFIGGKQCLVIGTISMDIIVADITHLDNSYKTEGTVVEIYGDNITVNDTARLCKTNACEIFNTITTRYPVLFI